MNIAERLSRVRERIEAASARAGRDPASVRLVVVSKRQPTEAIKEAATAGALDIGENYAQEMLEKIDAVPGLRWHFIGHLQRNKAKLVVGKVELIHTVDSAALAREIGKRARALGVEQAVLCEVNLAGEESKSGVAPLELPELLAVIRDTDGISATGLMAIPPWPEAPEDSRPFFRMLRELAGRCSGPGQTLGELSMGTTGDLEVAVEEGATLVRVGTAIFGPRPT